MTLKPRDPVPPTTASLRTFLQTTTLSLSTAATTISLPTLPTHTTLKRLIHRLIHLLRTTLTTRITTLTHSLQRTQAHLQSLLSTLSLLSTSLSHHSALRASHFEQATHRLACLTAPSAPLHAPRLPFTLPSLPFTRRASDENLALQRRERERERVSFAECARELARCDGTVRRLTRTHRDIVREVREVRSVVAEGVRSVKELIRCDGRWGVVDLLVERVDEGLEDVVGVGCAGVGLVIARRWHAVAESLEGVEDCEVEVGGGGEGGEGMQGMQGVEEVVEEIKRVVGEVCGIG